MKEYTMIDFEREINDWFNVNENRRDIKCVSNPAQIFIAEKIINLTNKNIELEERVKIQENRSFTGYRGNK
jgi:hypothetical protein